MRFVHVTPVVASTSSGISLSISRRSLGGANEPSSLERRQAAAVEVGAIERRERFDGEAHAVVDALNSRREASQLVGYAEHVLCFEHFKDFAVDAVAVTGAIAAVSRLNRGSGSAAAYVLQVGDVARRSRLRKIGVSARRPVAHRWTMNFRVRTVRDVPRCY